MARAQSFTAAAEQYENEFETAFAIFLDKGDRSALVDYLLSRSNLPGPRANLELLHRFCDSVERRCDGHRDKLWELCVSFLSIPKDKAFTGSPMEFIPMCGAVGMGAIGASDGAGDDAYFDRSMERLKTTAGDPRWRVRESVAFALQKILSGSRQRALSTLSSWVEPEQWLQMRAVAAGIAEPPLLKDPVLCRHALRLHRTIIDYIVDYLRAIQPLTLSAVMKSEPFRKLVQALEYSVSVVVAASPDEGFAFLRQLADAAARPPKDPGEEKAASILRKIVKINLKKARLSKTYPSRVDELMKLID